MADNKYEKAKKRVEEIKGFYSHLIVYVVINIGLFLINLFTSPGEYQALPWNTVYNISDIRAPCIPVYF